MNNRHFYFSEFIVERVIHAETFDDVAVSFFKLMIYCIYIMAGRSKFIAFVKLVGNLEISVIALTRSRGYYIFYTRIREYNVYYFFELLGACQ